MEPRSRGGSDSYRDRSERVELLLAYSVGCSVESARARALAPGIQKCNDTSNWALETESPVYGFCQYAVLLLTINAHSVGSSRWIREKFNVIFLLSRTCVTARKDFVRRPPRETLFPIKVAFAHWRRCLYYRKKLTAVSYNVTESRRFLPHSVRPRPFVWKARCLAFQATFIVGLVRVETARDAWFFVAEANS